MTSDRNFSATSSDHDQSPLVSVIVTCFNRERTIARALLTVLDQTYSNFEIVVVDDGSTDGSLSEIMSIQDTRIRLITHKLNNGQNAAINTGFESCRGDLIAFLDSDDVWRPKFLEMMVDAFHPFTESSTNFAYCRLIRGPKWHLEGCDQFPSVLAQGYLSALGTLVVKASAFSEILPLPVNRELSDMCQDDRICFELARRGCFVHVPEELYEIVGENNSVTRNLTLVANGWEKLFEDYRDEIIHLCGIRVLVDHQIGVSRRLLVAHEFKRTRDATNKHLKIIFGKSGMSVNDRLRLLSSLFKLPVLYLLDELRLVVRSPFRIQRQKPHLK